MKPTVKSGTFPIHNVLKQEEAQLPLPFNFALESAEENWDRFKFNSAH
jgi:hypothetical protein